MSRKIPFWMVLKKGNVEKDMALLGRAWFTVGYFYVDFLPGAKIFSG